MHTLSAVNFLLSNTAFILYLKFHYVVHSYSLNSTKSLISLFLLWPSSHYVENCLVSLHESVAFLFLLLLLNSRLNSLWYDLICGCYFSFFLSVETCFVISHMVNFGECSVKYWERDILLCVWVKYSIDICYIHLSHNIY